MVPYTKILTFFVNGKKVIDDHVNPEWTLLYYLRTKLRLCGTKLGCGEGGCGACTVMVSKYDRINNKITHLPVNACLAPICSVHGLSVTTIEGIGSVKTKLHPVQERIAKAHGSQCGFCTPGIVMSMYTLLRTTPKPTMGQLEVAFQGNLCRCTGYRPIIEGYKTFTEEWELIRNNQQINGNNSCSMGDKCCKLRNNHELLFKTNEFTPYDPTQEPIFPPELQISDRYDRELLQIENEEVVWYRPVTLRQLFELKKLFVRGKIVGGCTEIAIETKFKNIIYPVLIYAKNIEELTRISTDGQILTIGAAVTLSNFEEFLRDEIGKLPEFKTRILRAFVGILEVFGGKQVRSVATIGGNIMTASPISDIIPILMASNSRLQLQSSKGIREVKFDNNFIREYRTTLIQPDEVLVAIKLPYSKENRYFQAYKQAKRRDDDIAIVNFAINVEFQPNSNIISDIQLAFGGISFKTVLAEKTQRNLKGLPWNRQILESTYACLLEELPLEDSAPGGLVEYRKSLILSLFFRGFLAISTNLHPDSLDRRELSGVESFRPKPYKSSQYFTIIQQTGERIDGLQQPIVHLSAYKQATGEAKFVDDIPVENELQLVYIVSSRAHAKITKIDASDALKIDGVVDFLSADDIKTDKNISGQLGDEKIFYDGKITSEGQRIGAILAIDRFIARKAARLVRIEYEELDPVIVTIKDAIRYNSFFEHPHPLFKNGDIEAILTKSDHILAGEVEIGGQEHFYFETQSVVVIPKEVDELEVFVSCQMPKELSVILANYFDLPQNRIAVKVRRIGGGFGGKETKSVINALPVAIAAVKHNRPVRCMLDRDEDIVMTGGRNPFLIKYRVGFNRDGRIGGLDVELYANCGFSVDYSLIVLERAMTHIQNSYNIRTIQAKLFACKTNTRSNTAFRGFGIPQALYASETIIHHIADFLEKDPTDIRLLNLYKEGDFTHYNQKLIDNTLEQCWQQCVQSSNFEQRRQFVGDFNQMNRYKKRGITLIPTTFGIGFPIDHLNQGAALILVYTDGSVLLHHGGVEMGQGLHTKMIQVASRCLGIPIEKIHTTEISTDKIPNPSTTAASYSSDLNGMAIMNACNEINERLKPYKLENPEGRWEDWVNKAYLDRVNLSATGFYKTPDIYYNWETNQGSMNDYFSYGVACCEVEIDTLTGDHRVVRVDIVMDVGQSLNPAIDIGQIEGGFMQGYGLYVLEELIYSPKGISYTRGPSTYKIPSFGCIPGEFNVSLLKGASNPRAVFSSKAIGEPPLGLGCSVVFAIRNAIKAARAENGIAGFVRLDSPATPDKIRLACQDRISTRIERAEPEIDNLECWRATGV